MPPRIAIAPERVSGLPPDCVQWSRGARGSVNVLDAAARSKSPSKAPSFMESPGAALPRLKESDRGLRLVERQRLFAKR